MIKIRLFILNAGLVIFFSFFIFPPAAGTVLAQSTAAELRQKIEESNSEVAKLEEEIKSYENELTKLGTEKNTLQNAIKELDLTRKKLSTDIKITEQKIKATNLEIERLRLVIDDKSETIDLEKEGLAEGIRQINEFDSNNLVELVLSNQMISNAWDDIENIKSIHAKIREHVAELKESRKSLNQDKDETEAVKDKLLDLKSDLTDQREMVEQNKKEKDRLLKETRNRESSYKKILENKLALKEKLERELEDYESRLRFILDPSTLPKEGSGVLSWPMENILITQMFGATKDSRRLYASGTHSGVDFRASVGTKVSAMANGVIAGTGDTDPTCPGASYGKWILIKYDNGLASTYGHLSMIKASAGDPVQRGDLVGYSGNTGYSTAPHLHVTVYAREAVEVLTRPSQACQGKTYTMPLAARNAYLDPILYLPPLSPEMIKDGIL